MLHFSPFRRRLLLACGAACAPGLSLAAAAPLPTPASLPDELAAALAKGGPLLVMVSLDGCPYCRIVRENYLGPMRQQEGLSVVQLDMHSQRRVKDFNGVAVTHDQMIRGWGIKVAPTVLFFGRGGAELAERLVGGYIPDFYGAYLDDRLQQARITVRQ